MRVTHCHVERCCAPYSNETTRKHGSHNDEWAGASWLVGVWKEKLVAVIMRWAMHVNDRDRHLLV